jgi:hypothetical protein
MNNETLGLDNRAILGQLFKTAFGTMPVYLTVPLGKEKQADLSGFKPEILEEVTYEDALRKSLYGTPIIFPVLFKGGTYKVYQDRTGKIVDEEFEDLWLPATTMVDFGRSKNIIKTNMLGNEGTVKEVYGFDDWQVRIRILCIKGEFSARKYVDKLNNFNRIIKPISVEGSLFSAKSIDSIVIESLEEKSVEGSPNVIPIELSCVSDEAMEITINNLL